MTCIGCGGEQFTEILSEESDVFEGIRFMAMLPARKCCECSWIYLDPPALAQYEHLIAERLRAVGAHSEHSLALIRRASRLSGGNLERLRDQLDFRDSEL
jgi:hypothetical protein